MPTLHSIALFVTDMDRALIFYRDHLGLPLTRQGSFGAEFLEEPPHLGVHPAAHPNAIKMVGRETGITLRVDDIHAFCQRLKARGATVLTEPVEQSFGWMAMVADPDGNAIAVWQAAGDEKVD